MESVLEESKGKAGLNCMQLAPSWLVTLLPCLVSSSVCHSVSRYTKGGEGSQSGARKTMERQWEEVIQKCCYGTNRALIPKSIFFSALHKYCISVEKYIISIIKCSLLLRSRFLYKLL